MGDEFEDLAIEYENNHKININIDFNKKNNSNYEKLIFNTLYKFYNFENNFKLKTESKCQIITSNLKLNIFIIGKKKSGKKFFSLLVKNYYNNKKISLNYKLNNDKLNEFNDFNDASLIFYITNYFNYKDYLKISKIKQYLNNNNNLAQIIIIHNLYQSFDQIYLLKYINQYKYIFKKYDFDIESLYKECNIYLDKDLNFHLIFNNFNDELLFKNNIKCLNFLLESIQENNNLIKRLSNNNNNKNNEIKKDSSFIKYFLNFDENYFSINLLLHYSQKFFEKNKINIETKLNTEANIIYFYISGKFENKTNHFSKIIFKSKKEEDFKLKISKNYNSIRIINFTPQISYENGIVSIKYEIFKNNLITFK
jgi:hypothetical protein